VLNAKAVGAPRGPLPQVAHCMCAALLFFTYCIALGFAARAFLSLFAPALAYLP